MNKKTKKTLSTALKIGVSVLFLYFVYSKISFQEVFTIVKKSNLFFLLLSMVLYALSQLVSAQRLMLYLKKLEVNISHKENYILYAIGMFYNFFIPGGIGGDAYKVIYINKHKGVKIKPTTSALLLDRLIGLVMILVLILLLMCFVSKIPSEFRILSPILLIAGVAFTYFLVNKIWNKYTSILTQALLYSFVVQVLQIFSIICILKALHITENELFYVLMFLVSSVLGVISFGGIGVREFVFLKAAQLLEFNTEISVSIGLIFTLLAAIISLAGMYFHVFEKKYLKPN